MYNADKPENRFLVYMKVSRLKKILLLVASIIFIAVCQLCYMPFVQLKDIDVEDYLGAHLNNSTYDQLYGLKSRIELYQISSFIHKGDAYTDIPFHDENGIQRIMNIKFNWNNTITVSKGSNKYDINVDKIEFEPEMYHPADEFSLIPETDDSVFVGILFLDNKKNGIEVLRQKKTLPYGGRRIAFRIIENKKVYSTGKSSLFNY